MQLSEDNCQFLTHLFDSLATGIFVTDRNAVVRLINKTYADYLGYPKDQIIGRHITEFIPDSRAPQVAASGVAEMGVICPVVGRQGERVLIVNRQPLEKDGDVLGVISQALFGSREEYEALSRHIESLDKEVKKYARRVQSMFSPRYSLASIIGGSQAVEKMRELITSYAATSLPVLIEGDTGTGKELAAGAIHCESQRNGSPFVSVNCAAIPKELFESELFGYAPGAFSGALKEGKVGLIEMADRGTLFLDEIGDAPLSMQAKLLRVLEERTMYRLGSTKPRTVDFRLVAATNRNLKKMIGASLFREDLYYRMSSLVLRIPGLGERKEDIPALVSHFLRGMRREELTVDPTVIQAFQAYNWPGNIRELYNAVGRAAGLCDGQNIELNHLPLELLKGPGQGQQDQAGLACALLQSDLASTLADNERQAILCALQEHAWNVSRAAKKLGIGRATIYKKMHKHGIAREEYPPGR